MTKVVEVVFFIVTQSTTTLGTIVHLKLFIIYSGEACAYYNKEN